VIIEFNGHSVNARVPVAMLQRITGNATQTMLERYWVPVVFDGQGTIGSLCSQDHICLYPATPADIKKINEPRTTDESGDDRPIRPAHPVVPGKMKPNFLGQQVTREPFQPWSDFPVMLSRDKMVHVVTGWDGDSCGCRGVRGVA
jgi:hypothetical protein